MIVVDFLPEYQVGYKRGFLIRLSHTQVNGNSEQDEATERAVTAVTSFFLERSYFCIEKFYRHLNIADW